MKQSYRYYYSDDLTFVATAILLDKVTIEEIKYHPQKKGVKIFGLSPATDAEKLFRLYISDKLKISPQRLNAKISAIRFLPTDQKGSIYGG